MDAKRYECDHCGWNSNDMDAMLVHLREKHGLNDPALDPESVDWHVVDMSPGHETGPRQVEGD